MCTLVVATRAWPQLPLLVAANRDEMRDRPASPPAWRPLEHGGRMFAPRDERAGGTWIGMNAAGVFAALTNRFKIPFATAARSRGEIVPRALAAGTAAEAAEALAGLDAPAYGPFHVFVADRSAAWWGWSAGEELTLEPLEPGVYSVTEQDFGATRPIRSPAVLQAARAWETAPDDPALEALLGGHGPSGLCVHRHGIRYGTRSSTIIRVGDEPGQVTWRHAEGPPCVTPWDDYSGAAIGIR